MKIERIQKGNPTFGYSHPLKTAFDKGLLPDVHRGLFGYEINKKTRSIEHLTPKSLGGKLTWDNVALTHKLANSERGITPINEVVTKEMWIDYLKQFVNVKNKFVDGMSYIWTICKRFHINIKDVLN
jgi:hypothetical protein